MSKNFLQFKKDVLKDIASVQSHTPESWADIMLKNIRYLDTIEDQKDFWRWILNPAEERGAPEIKFRDIEPVENVLINKFEKLTISSEEDEKQMDVDITMENVVVTNGLTTYIKTTPVITS